MIQADLRKSLKSEVTHEKVNNPNARPHSLNPQAHCSRSILRVPLG